MEALNVKTLERLLDGDQLIGLQVVILVLRPVVRTDDLKTFSGFCKSEYFYLLIGAKRNYWSRSDKNIVILIT